MAGSEDTELRDLVLEALEKNGSLAKIRALLRANIFLAFENERDPTRQNPALDRLLGSPEGALALSVVAEFLDFCNLKNTAFVYKAESRQGRSYRYEGRRNLPDHLAKEYAAKQEPVLVTILRQALSRRRKHYEKEDNETMSPNKEVPRKDDDNCTYIVHDESGSTRSQSDNSSDDKNKLLLRLPLDNSDTDTSSDSRDKTHSEYIPNANIPLEGDSEDDKHLHYVLSPKSYIEDAGTKVNTTSPHENYGNAHNATYTTEEHANVINSSESTSYLDLKPKTMLKLANGNVDPDDRSPNVHSLIDISEHIEGSSQRSMHKSEPEKQSSADSQTKSVLSNVSNVSLSQGISTAEKSSQQQTSSKAFEKSSKSYNYSEDFSPVQESIKTNKQSSPRSTDSDSLREDISLNGSEHQRSSESPVMKSNSTTHSSVSISDIAELIENSARSSPLSNARSQLKSVHKSVIVRNSNLDEVAQRLTSLFRNDEKRMSSTKNSSEEISESPIQSLSNISLEVHSD